MARDPNIPLFLWVAAAIVAHLTWGGGAEQVAEVFEERADVRRFAASVQSMAGALARPQSLNTCSI